MDWFSGSPSVKRFIICATKRNEALEIIINYFSLTNNYKTTRIIRERKINDHKKDISLFY